MTVARSIRLHALAGTFGLVLLLATSVASADDEPTTSAAALQKFDEGRKALEAGDHQTALAAFDASNRLLASPNSLLYMARCYKALGKVASAYTTYRTAYKQSQDRLVATGDKRYVGTRDSAAHEAAEIEADVPKLAVVVPADVPAGFVLTQNGVAVSPSSWGSAVDTDAGHVVIESSGPRLVPFHEELDLLSGETRRVDVGVVRVPTAVVRLHLRSLPLGLTLRIDGMPIDVREVAAPREVDPGVRTIEAMAPGHRDFRWQRTLVDGEVSDVDVAVEAQAPEARSRKIGTPRWLFWTTAGAAVVAIGTGAVLAVRANSRSNDEEAKNPFARDPSERDSIRTESTVANAFFVSGAVLGAGAVALALVTEWNRPGPGKKPTTDSQPPPPSPRARVHLTPIGLAGGAGGLAAAGTF
jgi:hypothetical protein